MSLSRIFLFFSAIAVVFLLLPALSEASEPSEEPAKPVMMDLMSPGCPACVELAKVLAVFKEKHGDRIDVVTVNVRDNPDLARVHRVRYVPTVVFIDEQGKVLERRVGYMPLEALENEWAKHGYDLTSGE